MKLLLGSILSHIKQQFPDATIQQETNQIVFPVRIDYAEFYVFLKIYEDSKLLQLMTFFPVQYLQKYENDLALTLHFFNGQLDIPGFGMEFESRSMFYRLLIPTIHGELDEALLEKYIKASIAVLKAYGPFIYNVATGKLTFEEILKKGKR